jgi:hypothetical protein
LPIARRSWSTLGAPARRGRIRHLRASPVPIRLTLLGALCRKRQSEITDALVDLLIGLVHKVNATPSSAWRRR